MKVCIVGAGAIGGFIGARLAAAGQCDLSVVARGATLAALQTHGWRLQEAGNLLQAPAHAVADPAELGVQDLVILAVKGPALAEVARQIQPLLGPDTVLLPAMNGVPWWFGHGVPALGSQPLSSVDPDGAIGAALPFENVLGCVVYMATWLAEPGLVMHKTGNKLVIGEPGGALSRRAQKVQSLLAGAGIETPLSANIRYDAWYKLWGNLTINPVSAITGATADVVLDDALVREFCIAAMREAGTIGQQIGCAIPETPEHRNLLTRTLGSFKTSMLQDTEAGRPLELDNIVGAVREIGQRLGIATPHIDALLGLTRLFARVRGLYPAQAA
ncbi:2-dehydropantoate 2-reductase [Janthinobacterium sp.]|uniref:2-dehydropantoate 2-reductase n=1 Tax=Janthinobacterium sp. TaxID=1871054 RepID=UPI0026068A39|nr:2-dehydropantoate 2-reductase [Janthinobacterium sp.]